MHGHRRAYVWRWNTLSHTYGKSDPPYQTLLTDSTSLLGCAQPTLQATLPRQRKSSLDIQAFGGEDPRFNKMIDSWVGSWRTVTPPFRCCWQCSTHSSGKPQAAAARCIIKTQRQQHTMLDDSPALHVKLGTMVVPTWQGETNNSSNQPQHQHQHAQADREQPQGWL